MSTVSWRKEWLRTLTNGSFCLKFESSAIGTAAILVFTSTCSYWLGSPYKQSLIQHKWWCGVPWDWESVWQKPTAQWKNFTDAKIISFRYFGILLGGIPGSPICSRKWRLKPVLLTFQKKNVPLVISDLETTKRLTSRLNYFAQSLMALTLSCHTIAYQWRTGKWDGRVWDLKKTDIIGQPLSQRLKEGVCAFMQTYIHMLIAAFVQV